jgi:hypothetical protein
VRHILIIVAVCTLFISGIGHLIHNKQLSDAELGAKDLRAYAARVEEVQHYRCRGGCYRLIVSYVVNGERQRSQYSGRPMLVGQTLTVWAKPNFQYAYISPQAYISNFAPSWSPTSLLFLPLLAISGAVASTKLNAWRNN